jgi:hypothetical protein
MRRSDATEISVRLSLKLVTGVALCALATCALKAQSATDMAVLKGLAPVTMLERTPAGQASLAANYTVTGGIQTGAIRQATLLPFAEQQQQALQDAFITDGDLAQLADGLGTTLGAAYVARAHYLDRTHFTNVSKPVQYVIAYAMAIAGSNSNAAKYFFANETTNGNASVSAEAKEILKDNGGRVDMFGRNYGRPAGTDGADKFGDSRPFQTEPSIAQIIGPDYFNVPANNDVYNRGPIMNLISSPSYPSGHTTYGYTGSLVLALLVPQRYQQMVTRGAEYGNDRILMGAHYAMDVLGGRTLATYDLAHVLANDPVYVGRSLRGTPVIKDFRELVKEARTDITSTLQAACGKTIEECAKEDTGRFNNPVADEAFYDSTQTYNLPGVYRQNAGRAEDVSKVAPEAGYLLTVAYPQLTLEQADRILTETEGPGGGFLDDGSAFGVYSRLDLYAAAGRAAQVAGQR